MFAATGWDVLRPENLQGDTRFICKDHLVGMSKKQLQAIYRQLYGRPPEGEWKVDLLKEKILEGMDDEDNEAPEVQEAKPKRSIDDREADAKAKLRALQGRAKKQHRVYDLFNMYYNLIDRLDQQHYAYFHRTWNRKSNAYGLMSAAATYMMANCRAIWEEHRRELVNGRTKGNNRAVAEMEPLSTPQYVVQVIKQYLAKTAN